MAKLLEAQRLSFSWRGKAGFVKNLSMELDAGQIYGLVGRNGAGKTTLIKLLTGCLTPKSGTAILQIDGQAFNTARRVPRALSELMFVPETVLLPALTTRQFGKLAGSL